MYLNFCNFFLIYHLIARLLFYARKNFFKFSFFLITFIFIRKFRIRKKRILIVLEDLNSGQIWYTKPGVYSLNHLRSFQHPILFSSMDLEFLHGRASKATWLFRSEYFSRKYLYLSLYILSFFNTKTIFFFQRVNVSIKKFNFYFLPWQL